MKIEPYKHRAVDRAQDVWVYRNLMRTDGVWYSLMQRGLVVGHTREIVLVDCRFIVRAEGHARAVRTGVKNVHAFVVGRIEPLDDPDRLLEDLGAPMRAGYRIANGPRFTSDAATIVRADHAHLGQNGLTIRSAG